MTPTRHISSIDSIPIDQLCAEWLGHGLSTEPADFDTAERLITGLYAKVGLPVPSQFVRVSSPPAGLRKLAEYEAAHGLPEPVFVPSTGWQGEYYETRGRTWMAIDEKPWDTVVWAVWEAVTPDAYSAALDALYRPLEDRISDKIRNPLWHQAAEDVDLTDEDTAHRWRGSCNWGQHQAALLCYYSGMGLLGVDVSAIQPHVEIGKVCGWWWGLDDLVIVADRPVEIGAAIAFRDDWAAILTEE